MKSACTYHVWHGGRNVYAIVRAYTAPEARQIMRDKYGSGIIVALTLPAALRDDPHALDGVTRTRKLKHGDIIRIRRK